MLWTDGTGHNASGSDTWKPLENLDLTNYEEAIAAFERATDRTFPRPAQRPPLAATTGPAPPAFPRQPGGRVHAPPSDFSASFVTASADSCSSSSTRGRTMAGSAVASPCRAASTRDAGRDPRLCPRPAFSHIVEYTRHCAANVLLSPTAAPGVQGRARHHP
jgi:hypothetical protein